MTEPRPALVCPTLPWPPPPPPLVRAVLQTTAFVPVACKELVKLLRDAVLAVRQKAAWALGNVFTSFEDVGASRMVASLFTLADLRSTAAALSAGLDDHDKVAVACVRGLGRCIVGLFEMCGEIPPDPLYSGVHGNGPPPSASPPPSPHRSLFAADLENASAVIRTIASSTLSGGVKVGDGGVVSCSLNRQWGKGAYACAAVAVVAFGPVMSAWSGAVIARGRCLVVDCVMRFGGSLMCCAVAVERMPLVGGGAAVEL